MTVGKYLTEWLAATRNRIGYGLSDTGWRDHEVHIRRHITRASETYHCRHSTRTTSRGSTPGYRTATRREENDGQRQEVHNIHLTLHRTLDDAIHDGLIPETLRRDLVKRRRPAPR